MEHKTARLTLLIDPHKKAAFERLCANQDRTASQVVRQLIRDYLAHHGVAFQAGGGADDLGAPAVAAATPSSKARAGGGARPRTKRGRG